MVAAYYGINLSQDEIVEGLGSSGVVSENTMYDGIFEEDLAKAARFFGFNARIAKNLGLKDIIRNINNEHPIIALVWPSRHYQKDCGHYYVIKGYQTNPNIVYLNDPAELSLERELYENFRRIFTTKAKDEWNRCGIIFRGKLLYFPA